MEYFTESPIPLASSNPLFPVRPTAGTDRALLESNPSSPEGATGSQDGNRTPGKGRLHKEFVNEAFAAARERFTAKRKGGARAIARQWQVGGRRAVERAGTAHSRYFEFNVSRSRFGGLKPCKQHFLSDRFSMLKIQTPAGSRVAGVSPLSLTK